MLSISRKQWIGCGIAVAVILFFIYYVWSDRVAPTTNDAYVEAHVIQVAPRVDGRVVKVAVRNNQAVKKGQLLFALDDAQYVHAMNQRKALLIEAKEQVHQLEAQASAAKAALKKSQDNLSYMQKQYEANKKLLAEKAIPQLAFDQLSAAYREQQAEVQRAQFQLLNIMQLLHQSNGEYAQVMQARAALNQARQNFDDTKVYAPFDGRVSFLRVSRGMYATAGTPVMAVIDTRHFWVIARIKENNLERVRKGQRVDVAPEIYPGYHLQGRVESIGWGVNLDQSIPPVWMPYIPRTRNWVRLAQRFPVQIAVKPEPGYPLRVGGTVLVTIYTEKTGVIHWLSTIRQNVLSWLQYLY